MASWSRTKRSTKLSYTPLTGNIISLLLSYVKKNFEKQAYISLLSLYLEMSFEHYVSETEKHGQHKDSVA